MMDGVQSVLQRIANIEQRFGVASAASASPDFAAALTNAEQTASPSVRQTSGTVAASGSDITQLIDTAARKYGVDPKLAMAVATTESNLAPDAVSPAGAVGVMQLMPATAASLGVHNIADSRENIDGGVKYLRQMLDTFHGSAVNAVAAYNAGPQAVKDYGGVPPYAETQAYVHKVLSLYG